MKIALLGVSHWHAQMHFDAAIAAGASVVGAWDKDRQKAGQFGSRYGVPVIADFDAALEMADFVVLMGHPCDVPDLARRVIEAGVPMLIEKPAVTETAQLEALCALAEAHDAFVGLPLPNRLGPVPTEHQRLLNEGRAGPLAHSNFRLVNGPPQRYRDDGVGWLLEPQIGGGGALRNLGIHGIDAALSLARGELRIVSSQIGKRIYSQEAVEDHALVILADETDAFFVVEAGYTFALMRPGGDFEWRIACANATLIDRGDTAFAATLDDNVQRPLAIEPTTTRYRLFTADAIARLNAGQKPAVTIHDYLAAMRLIDAAYQKAQS
ncbi:Gfo/Idh/MocA family oxidoreductase [Pelagibacterium sp. H642]|uniref:Gfo/Idh/MocA family protein n=1 Tax=Pelagibacterium sp. H642 TaxID=1881069 RepID=UPI002814CE25|nr:Gfo/Idh/MocA family oxidoreductase [Pelagibacterium sp. H642]WMT92775.1 Gfo/Idh/MocA family oxidoreductase [Pelagibacterium sp. H642]